MTEDGWNIDNVAEEEFPVGCMEISPVSCLQNCKEGDGAADRRGAAESCSRGREAKRIKSVERRKKRY